MTPRFSCPRVWEHKNPEVPLFRVCPQTHQLQLLFCYLVIASRWNYFKSSLGKPGLTASVGCSAVNVPRSQLSWWQCDCQSGSWAAGQGILAREEGGILQGGGSCALDSAVLAAENTWPQRILLCAWILTKSLKVCCIMVLSLAIFNSWNWEKNFI